MVVQRHFRIALLAGLAAAGSAFSQPHEKHHGTPPRSKLEAADSRIFGSLSDFDVLHYSLDLRFPLTSSELDGSAVLTIRSVRDNLGEIELHAVNLNIVSISVPKQSASWNHANGLIRIRFNRSYALGDTFSVRIVYYGKPQERGFYFYPLCAYTFSEPEDARAWFPCRDVPWDKATAEIRATVPSGVQVASVGLLKSRTFSPDGKWETFHWVTSYPVATYLLCVNVSRDYSRWSDWYVTEAKDSIEIVNYIFRRDSSNAVKDLVHLKDALAFFSAEFGSYPFEKFGVAEVEPFRYGGMEHQTMVTFNSIWIQGNRNYESGFVHELAHMWWGDAVTLDSWPDIWLNEGFATYCEALFDGFYYGPDAFRLKIQRMKRDYLDQADRNDFPVYNPPSGELFNWGIVYSKGGLVLHMLRHVVGEAPFRQILRDYFRTFRYRTCSTADFQNVCESVSAKKLDWFFQEWIYGKGCPEISYSYSEQPLQSGGFQIALQVRQLQESGVWFRMPLDVRLAGVKDTVVQLANALDRFVFTASRRPDSLVLDPDGWILMVRKPASNDIREDGELPDGFSLYSAFPNPFNTETTFFYDIPDTPNASRLTLAVYDLLGKPVRMLAETEGLVPGKYRKTWDGKDAAGRPVSSGVYILKMTAGKTVLEQKAVLAR